MTKADLPWEVDREPLDYERLESVLDMIEGEPVIVRLTACAADKASTPGVASIVGELSRRVPARYAGQEFALGSPYPDLNPEYLAGGVLFINEEEFESATLTTYDGNDYFVISIWTRGMEILVQDRDSTYP